MKVTKLVLICALLITIFVQNGVKCFIDNNEYNHMPALYKLDEYDKCLDDSELARPAVYCIVKTVIKPDNASDEWRLIEKYSSNRKINFRHEILERGICMKECEELVDRLHIETKNYLYQDAFNSDLKLTLPPQYFRNTLEYRKVYNMLVNQCVNFELRNDHNLSAYSEIEYCTSTDDNVSDYDLIDLLFFIVLFALLATVLCSTLLDISLKKVDGIEHYLTALPSRTHMMLVSFSIPRNWYQLTIEKDTPLARDLRFIHTQRFIAMMLVIFSHSFFLNNIIPVKNPQNVEENFNSLLIGAIDWIRSYFVLSAFLITILFMDDTQNKVENANYKYFWRGLIERYIRLTPVYAFVILFHATMLIKMGNGPVWNKYVAVEYINCRTNWWTNLLFINNYVKADEPCVGEGWYLGADFQLFIFARFIRLMIWRYPKMMKYILGIGIALSYVCVGLVTYYKELDGALVISLDAQQTLMAYDSNFHDGYIPSHMNFGNTLIGILGGIVYYKLRQQKFNAKENKIFNIFWHCCGPLIVLVVAISKIFYLYEFETPSIWMAICATFIRHLWAWLFCTIFIGLGFRVNDFISNLYNYSAFRTLGRISYCVYLCHVSIMAMITLSMRDPKYFSATAIHLNFVTALSLSCFVGLILSICIELPTAHIYKQLNKKK